MPNPQDIFQLAQQTATQVTASPENWRRFLYEPENEVERLIRQIQAIQKELPAHNDPFLEDEQAYDEAAYEHYALTGYTQVSYQNTRRKADIWTL